MHTDVSQIPRLLRRVLSLLEKFRPERQDGDTLWRGPHFIPKSGQWWPTTFLRYEDELFATAELGWSALTIRWTVGSDRVVYEPDNGWEWRNCPELWTRILPQIEKRLRAALRDPDAYNRRVARQLPVHCRTGKILRKWTWPTDAEPPLGSRDLLRLETALRRGGAAPVWKQLTVQRFLDVAALAYDAAFPDMKDLSPRAKYEARADSRHGGMLDLDPEDPEEFARWFSSRRWLGAHPWEIVFAHPHGVLLSPHLEEDVWRFYLSVDTLGLYVAVARMAVGLGEEGIPFELFRAEEVIAALRGEDEVEVGPFRYELSLEELEERRPGASRNVVWEEPPQLTKVEKPGSRSLRSP